MSNEISGNINIAASKEHVWGILSNYGSIDQWAALVSKSEASGTGVGAERTCNIIDGAVLVETVDQWTEGKGFRYQIAGMPTKSAATTWTVAPEGNGTKVGFHLAFDAEAEMVAPLTEKISGFRDFLLAALKTNAETGAVIALPTH